MADSVELRQQIEDLAVRLVVADSDATVAPEDWIPTLNRIRDTALRDQAEHTAAEASAMLNALQEGMATSSGFVSLQEGITRVQEAVSRDAKGSTQFLSPAQDPELLSDFVMESREHLVAIEAQVLTLERDPLDAEALNSTFRGFHTIKGLAGFLELWEVQKLSHEVETVLDRARNFEFTITPAAIDIILESADYLRRWLAHMELQLHQQPSEPPATDDALLERIRTLSSETQAVESTGGLSMLASAVDEVATPSTPLAAQSVPLEEAPAASAPPQDGPAQVKEPSEELPATPVAAKSVRQNETMSVKVDTAKLDYLVDMAGEMVIAESLVRHDPELAALKSQKLQRKVAQLTRITSELQRTAMAMRLVPIGPLFRRMARLVRDLSRQFGKRVEMETFGDDIELDRTIVEELADPLMHMVRNALDHGIEAPQERRDHGKNPIARLLLKAQHQAGQVVIEIADDGRGLNREKIQAKAIERGLIGQGDDLSDTEIYNLVFLPGFSTATQVTSVSGRGVGMDVVRRHIEKLRGRIEIRSTPGEGSSFLLKLPLTLAIIDGLVVGVGQERYIVPLFAIREMFRPAESTIWTVQQQAEMALVRGSLLPVLRLYRKFNVKPRSEDPLQSVLLVAEAEGQRFCLLVDELIGKQEVVIKSLGETFQNVPGIAGGAILGDGRVGLILDLDRLCKDKVSDTSR